MISLHVETEKETQRIYFALQRKKTTTTKKIVFLFILTVSFVVGECWKRGQKLPLLCTVFSSLMKIFPLWKNRIHVNTLDKTGDCSEEFTVTVSAELDKIGKGRGGGCLASVL